MGYTPVWLNLSHVAHDPYINKLSQGEVLHTSTRQDWNAILSFHLSWINYAVLFFSGRDHMNLE